MNSPDEALRKHTIQPSLSGDLLVYREDENMWREQGKG